MTHLLLHFLGLLPTSLPFNSLYCHLKSHTSFPECQVFSVLGLLHCLGGADPQRVSSSLKGCSRTEVVVMMTTLFLSLDLTAGN